MSWSPVTKNTQCANYEELHYEPTMENVNKAIDLSKEMFVELVYST